VLSLALLLGGVRSVGAVHAGVATASTPASYDWTQFGGDARHSGDNTYEATLTRANVGGLQRLFHASLLGTEDGAPVYLSAVSTANGTQDLMFLTTKDGYTEALDAHTGARVWARPYGAGSCHINNGSSVCYTTSSPAIDPNRQYVYSYGLDGKVHKYAVGDGSEVISGGWPEMTTLKAFEEKGSSALAVATARNGVSYLYVAQAGYPGDRGDYQGHVTTINLADGSQNVFNANCGNQAAHFVEQPGTPDCTQTQTAVWSRPGVVYDPATDKIYFSTGNGDYNPTSHDWGDSILALAPGGTGVGGGPLDSYTPADYQQLQADDADLGSTSPVILPVPAASRVQHLALQAGKDGELRLVNLDNLSGQGGPGHTGGEVGPEINVPQGNEVLPTPAMWVDPSGTTWVFVSNDNGVSAFQLVVDSGGVPGLHLAWRNSTGGTSPLVANGVLYYAVFNGIHVLDPTTGSVLWQDNSLGGIHWESPIVVNGVLYITDGSGALSAYGLPVSPTPTPIPATPPNTAPAPTNTAPAPTATNTATATPTPVPATATPTPVPATATPSSIPSPFTSSDIGSVGHAGSASYANGTFTVAGSGADIWNTADAFHDVYQTLTGDGQIVARVASQIATDPWAKAGVMMRETLAADSRYADMVVTPGNGAAFQRRAATGGYAAHTAGPSVTAPYWVRLVRLGDTLTGYVSSDGVTWRGAGSDTVSMAATVYVGLAVTAHNNNALSTATFDHVAITPAPLAGLVGVWPFDEGTGGVTTDLSGNGNVGTLVGGVTWTAGRFGSALVFDDGTGYVSASANGLPAANAPQSVSWWLNVPTIPNGVADALSLTNDGAHAGVQPGFRNGRVGVWQWGGTWLVSTAPPSSNAWHHYVYTFDGTTHRLYVDGVSRANSTVTPQSAAPVQLQFGRWSGGHEYVKGSLDDVRIYNRALSAAEARVLAGRP